MVLLCKEFTVSCKNKRNPPNVCNTKLSSITREIKAKSHGGCERETQVGLS